MTASGSIAETAIICGGGHAGLVTARVLSEFFTRVIVVEKDPEPVDATPRRSIPQGRFVHALQAGCEAALSDLFPGFVDDLLAAGTVPLRMGQDIQAFVGGKWQPSLASELTFYSVTRPTLEHVIRARVAAIPNVQFLYESHVRGWLANPESTVIQGLVIESSGRTHNLEADFVVDAGGRGSSGRRWLRELGYENPRESTVKVDVRYVACLFHIPPDHRAEEGAFTIRDWGKSTR